MEKTRLPIPAGLADMPPGPELAAALAGIDLTRLGGLDCVTVMRAQHRQVAHEQARLMAAMVEVALCGIGPDDALPRMDAPDEFSADEIRGALVWTRAAATTQLTLAWDLRCRLSEVFATLERGGIDVPKAKVFSEWTGGLTDAQAQQVCDVLLPRAPELTTGQLTEQIKRLAIAIDPDWARRRYTEAVRGRKVVGYRNDDGSANLCGYQLPADRAAAACANLDGLARKIKHAGDGRPIDHIRADLYLAMLDGSYVGWLERDIIAHVLATSRESGPVQTEQPQVQRSDDRYGAYPAAPRDPAAASSSGGQVIQGPWPPAQPPATAGPAATGPASSQTHLGSVDRPNHDDESSEAVRPPAAHHIASPPKQPPMAQAPTAAFHGDGAHGHDGEDSAKRVPAGVGLVRDGQGGDGVRAPAAHHIASPSKQPPMAQAPTAAFRGDGAHGHDGEDSAKRVPADGDSGNTERSRFKIGGTDGQWARTVRRAGVEIRVEFTTLLGVDEHPGEIAGWGFVDAEMARGLVRDQTAAEWRYAITDDDGCLKYEGITRRRPDGYPPRAASPCRGGIVELQVKHSDLRRFAARPERLGGWAKVIADVLRQADQQEQGDQVAAARPNHGEMSRGSAASGVRSEHRTGRDDERGPRSPGKPLRRRAEIRDRTCTHPRCRAPAHGTDGDHIQEWARGGATDVGNVGSACRHDHRLRHDGGWRVVKVPSGQLVWISRLGMHYRVRAPLIIQPLPHPAPRQLLPLHRPDDHDGPIWREASVPPAEPGRPPPDLDAPVPF